MQIKVSDCLSVSIIMDPQTSLLEYLSVMCNGDGKQDLVTDVIQKHRIPDHDHH